MATGAEVLGMLIPTGGWVISGNDWEGVQFIEATPITQQEFEAGFAKCDAFKAKQALDALKAKSSAEEKLVALGLTLNDLKALGL
jgi:hypothetical protein